MSDQHCKPGWKQKSLIQLAEYHNGAAFNQTQWGEEGLPIIRIEQMTNPQAKSDFFSGALLPNNRIDDDDLIFSWSATLKVLLWDRGPGALNQHLFKVVPRPDTDLNFLKHLLNFNLEKLGGASQGSTMKHVTRKELARHQVCIPGTLEEQRQVASVLDVIDGQIAKTEALIAKHQQIKAGLMHDLFTQSASWEIHSLGDLSEVLDPNPSHRYPPDQDFGIPICSTENFHGEDEFDLSYAKFVPTYAWNEQNARCRFHPDDVVFARKGRIGLARRYGDQAKAFSHTVVTVKSKSPKLNQRWLLWLVRSTAFMAEIERTMNTNLGVPTLGIAFIQGIRVAVPPTPFQNDAAKHLDGIATSIRREQEALAKLSMIKSGLMRSLLTDDSTKVVALA